MLKTSALPLMTVFVISGSRQSVIQQTSRHEDSSGHYNTMRDFNSKPKVARQCLFLDEFDTSSADGHAVQRFITEENLRAFLGPAAAEAAQE